METSDPDDVMTLCLLASHPAVNLRAVTITPGSSDQLALVTGVLDRLNKSVPIGLFNIGHEKSCVSEFHYSWLGKFASKLVMYGGEGHRVITETIKKFPDVILLTGGPLKNPGKLFREYPQTKLSTWVGQGGFAGDNVVAPEHRLPKFVGKITCPTFNFNGDTKSAFLLLETENISKKILVSKNVCHGIAYDNEMHERFRPVKDKSIGLSLIYSGMDLYLKKHKDGKLFHDPLAAAVMINNSICEFVEVELYRERGEWGSRPQNKTNTFITVSLDKEKFIETMLTTE